MALNESLFWRQALWTAAVTGGIGLLVCFFAASRAFLLAFGVGFGLGFANLWALIRIVSMLQRSLMKRAAILYALKFLGLIGAIAFAHFGLHLDLLGGAAGFSTELAAILIASIWQHGRPGPEEDAEEKQHERA